MKLPIDNGTIVIKDGEIVSTRTETNLTEYPNKDSQPKSYDLLVYIGRFSPWHAGHRRVHQLALHQAKHVLILVGSAFQPRTIKNPFTYEERELMIQHSMDYTSVDRTTIRPLRDFLYNEQKWITQVQTHIELLTSTIPNAKVGIIGYEKDESSYYLRLFPQYSFAEVGDEYVDAVDATTIRRMWLTGQSASFTEGVLNKYTHDFMYNKFPTKEFDRLAREWQHIDEYHKQWAAAPYPPTFVTVDAIVIQSGHVLVVKRKSAPGEGLYALPGGFLNQGERIEDGMVRELREETKIKVPDPVIRGSVRARHVFDAPKRSLRGRTITHAFLVELPAGALPKVKGSDDAAKAKWMPLNEFEKIEDQFFEDHHHIIKYMLGRV